MITQSEVADSGISSDDFADIADSPDNFTRRFILQRFNPVFQAHDTNANSAFKFSVAADDTRIVRAFTNTVNLLVETLPVESVDQASPSSWTSPVVVEALNSPSIINVKCVKQASGWDIFFQRSSGKIGRAHSSDGLSWTVTDFSSYVLPLDTTLEWMAYGGGSIEMIYYITLTNQNAHWLQAIDTSGTHWDTGIYWHENLTGMDCEQIIDTSTDSTGDITGESIRHVLSFASALPGYFTYQNTSGTPVQIFIESGGVFSFIVRPPVAGAYRPIMVSQHHMVRYFDRVSEVNYRHTAHMTPMSSVFNPTNKRDVLWLATMGEDGDFNSTDASVGYTALYYYSSRDGINWSQDHIIPLDISEDYPTGVQIVKCGYYVYLISASTTLRSPLSSEFGPVVHPDLQLDVSHYVTQYSSSQSDMRNTSLALDNQDAHFNKTMLGLPGSFTLLTLIGQKKNGTVYLFQTAIEHVDSIQFMRQRPRMSVTIQARDRMSWLSDRSQSSDAIQYDNQIVGMDDYAPISTTAADSGLAHTAVVSGSFATVDHKLHLQSSYKEGVAFWTIATSIADGAVDTTFWMPNPHTRDMTSPTINGTSTPTYAGIVFRAIDKDNFWFVIYDFFAEAFNIGYRIGGTNVSLGFYSPGSWFNGQATTENYMNIHVEFRYLKLKLWVMLADGKLHNLVDQLLPGQGPSFTPFMQGYVGVIGSGWSDEDTVAVEPPATIPVIDPVTLDDLSPFTDTGTLDTSLPAPYPVGTVVKLAGENLFAGSSSHSYWLKNFISLATPTSHDNTPGTFTGWAIQAVLVKPNPTTVSVGGYVLAYNSGSHKSAVWYAPNIWATTPTWSKGADQDGKYTIIRDTNIVGDILIETPGSGAGLNTVFDFTTSDCGFTGFNGVTIPSAGASVWTNAVGWQSDPTYIQSPLYIWKDISATDIGSVEMIYQTQHNIGGGTRLIFLTDGVTNYSPTTGVNGGVGSFDDVFIFSPVAVGVTRIELFLDSNGAIPGQQNTISKFVLNPSSAHIQVALSTNNGSTFAAPVDVGAPGSSAIYGFDVSRNSATNYAAKPSNVRKATSLGGAYSDFVAFADSNPVCVIVPYYRRGSDTLDQTSASDPDFVAALDGPDGSMPESVDDFSTGQHGWSIVSQGGLVPSIIGSYSGGQFQAVDFTGDGGVTHWNEVFIHRLLGAATPVSSIKVTFDRVLTPGATGSDRGTVNITGKLGGVTVFDTPEVPGPTGVGSTYSWTGSETVDEIVIDVNQGHTTNNPNGGSASIKSVSFNGSTLYWIDGATSTKHDITPVSGMVFDNANCVTTHYGTHIAVFGKVGGVYKLYVSSNAGSTWTFVKNLTSPTFIRGRRTNPYTTRGQIYLADNGSIWYSSHWGQFGLFVRNMPSPTICFDTVW